MKLAIGISTVDENINLLYDKIKLIPPNIDIIIAHQTYKSIIINSDIVELKNVTIVTKNERGLSKSRNILLGTAILKNIDYLIISDDDVYYDAAGIVELNEFLEKNKSHNYHYQFQSCNCDNVLRKKYKASRHRLNRFDVFGVSSIEMCINITLVKSWNLKFDEMFGLGSIHSAGEEPIFLSDAIRVKNEIYFIPITITIHPLESSGIKLFTDEKSLSARCAIFKRCFGTAMGFIIVCAFWLKKFILERKNVNNKMSALKAFNVLIRGYFKNV